MFRWLKRLVTFLILAWAAIAALVAYLLSQMLRERFGRGGPMPASQAGMLLTPARRFVHPARDTLESFGLRAGETVLEIGPGPGYFTIEAGRMVGANGRVLCIDVQPGMIAILRERLATAGVTNACPIVADAARLPLAANAIDRCFMVTVLGEIPDRPRAMAELYRVLRPAATLSVLESLGDPDYMIEPHTRDIARASGFEVQEHRPTRLGYTMTLGRPSQHNATTAR